MADAELTRDTDLGELPSLAKLARTHLLGNERRRLLLDLQPPRGVKPRDHVVHVQSHYDPPSSASLARCRSKRLSALPMSVR